MVTYLMIYFFLKKYWKGNVLDYNLDQQWLTFETHDLRCEIMIKLWNPHKKIKNSNYNEPIIKS